MAKEFFTLDGLSELETALKEIDIGTRAAAIRDDLKRSSAPVLAAMQTKVPVDSGDLRASLGMRTRIGTGRSKTIAKVLVGVTKPRHEQVSAQSVAVEFGTRKQAAEPFMRPALIESTPAVLRDFQFRTWVRIKGIKVPLAAKGRK